ncbi:MAG: PAS domain S-box protein [Thermoleophilia bacterium]|nr:PAS domain S-box protein [Thermoleophilia bacterium]
MSTRPAGEPASAPLLDGLPGIFYVLSERGAMLRWNDRFESVSGYSTAELAAMHAVDFFAGPEKSLIAERIAEVFARGEADAEAHFVAKDGTATPYYFTGRRITLEGALCLVGMGLDLSEQRRAQERVDQNLRELTALHGIGQSLSTEIALDRVVRAAIEAIVAATRADPVMVFLRTERGLELRGAGPSDPGCRAPELGECLCGLAAREGRAVYSLDIRGDPCFTRNECKAAGIRSFACLPLVSEGRVQGVLALASRAERDFETQSLFLESIATAVSISLHNALLYERVTRHASELEQEVAARAEAEQSLRDLSVALSAAGDVALMTAPDGTITSVNAQFTELYGYTADEVVGKVTPRILKSGKQSAGGYEELWRTILRGESFRGEVVNRAKDGRLISIEETVTPFRDERGRIAGFLALQRDVTERVRAQRALRASEAQFRSLLANASDLITVIDERGTIRFQGPSSERLLGHAPAELTGHSAFDWIHPDDGPRVAADLQRAFATPGASVSSEFRFRHRDGGWRTLEAIGRAMTDPGREGLAVVNSRDVTDDRRLEEQLRQAQRMETVGRLAGGVAHDFNNILAVVLMRAELLLSEAADPEEVRAGLEEILGAAERAAGLTRQLLAFSRRQVLQRRDLDLNEVVSKLARMLERTIGEAVRLELRLAPGPLSMRADASMLDQVLLNLVVNARDAMPGGGGLVIATGARVVDEAAAAPHPNAAPGEYVWLSVSDTGHGIPAEILPHVFDPFFTTKGAGAGTGLGLATVFGIVEQHRGWVEVASEPGQGTRFEVLLPAAAAGARSEPGASEPPPRGGSETILLVEDDARVRRVTRDVLAGHGYRVLEAADGAEALERWDRQNGAIDLLITDMALPGGLNGQTLAAGLRERSPRLRVILTSGHSAEIAGRELALSPGQAFVQKPVAASALLAAVRRTLDG